MPPVHHPGTDDSEEHEARCIPGICYSRAAKPFIEYLERIT